MQGTYEQPPFRLDRLTIGLGAVLLALTIAAWAIVMRSNGAMDDEHGVRLTELSTMASMDGDDEMASTAATDMSDREMADEEVAMSPQAGLRMRIGVSEQMSSWPWGWTLVAFLGVWIAMMAAMMFPAAAPMTHAYARSARGRHSGVRASVAIGLFLAGYIIIWGGFGVGVFLANEVASETAGRWERVVDAGPYVGGVLLIGAGIYQFTWFKQLCLSKCRSPLSFIVREWRDGTIGALRMGVKHGLYCLGCCIGLMAGLIVVGVMSIPWMVTLAALIFAEKVTPWGPQVAKGTAAVMVFAGAALVVYGERLPGLA